MVEQPTAYMGTGTATLSSDLSDAELATRFQRHGDIAARNELVLRHLGLVGRMAGQFARRGSSYPDLVQEGCLGLMRAARSFDPGREVRFTTYAAFWIRSRMQRLAAADRAFACPIPTSATNQRGERFRRRYGHCFPPVSIDSVSADREELPLSERLAAEDETTDELVIRRQLVERLQAAVADVLEALCDERYQVIVSLRLLSDQPRSLNEVGREIALSHEGVRLMEKQLVALITDRIVDKTPPRPRRGPKARAA